LPTREREKVMSRENDLIVSLDGLHLWKMLPMLEARVGSWMRSSETSARSTDQALSNQR
jgi:hypothetical protein